MSTRRTAAALLILLTLGVVACGIPVDNSAQPIDPGAVSDVVEPQNEPQAPPPEPGGPTVLLYFADQQSVRPYRRSIQREPTLKRALELLIAGPTKQEQQLGATTNIPTRTRVLSVDRSDGIVTIDLSKEINDVGAPTNKLAYAQLVFTAFEFLPGTDQIRFLINGEPVKVPTDQGSLQLVQPSSYNYSPPTGG